MEQSIEKEEERKSNNSNCNHYFKIPTVIIKDEFDICHEKTEFTPYHFNESNQHLTFDNSKSESIIRQQPDNSCMGRSNLIETINTNELDMNIKGSSNLQVQTSSMIQFSPIAFANSPKKAFFNEFNNVTLK